MHIHSAHYLYIFTTGAAEKPGCNWVCQICINVNFILLECNAFHFYCLTFRRSLSVTRLKYKHCKKIFKKRDMSRFYGIYPNFNVDIAGQAPQTIVLTHCNLCIAALFSRAKSILLTLIFQIGAKLFLISQKSNMCLIIIQLLLIRLAYIHCCSVHCVHMCWCPCWNTSLCYDTTLLFKMYQLLHNNVIDLMTAEWLPTIMLAESLKLDNWLTVPFLAALTTLVLSECQIVCGEKDPLHKTVGSSQLAGRVWCHFPHSSIYIISVWIIYKVCMFAS